MEIINNWPIWILLGLCAGLLSGTLGVGSGTIVVPAMVLLFSFPQKSAQGTALAVMVPMAFLGAFRYWKNPQIEINFLIVLLLTAGALVGVLIGTVGAARLPANILRKIFAVFLIIVSINMLVFSGKKSASVGKFNRGTKTGVTNQKGEINESSDIGKTR